MRSPLLAFAQRATAMRRCCAIPRRLAYPACTRAQKHQDEGMVLLQSLHMRHMMRLCSGRPPGADDVVGQCVGMLNERRTILRSQKHPRRHVHVRESSIGRRIQVLPRSPIEHPGKRIVRCIHTHPPAGGRILWWRHLRRSWCAFWRSHQGGDSALIPSLLERRLPRSAMGVSGRMRRGWLARKRADG